MTKFLQSLINNLPPRFLTLKFRLMVLITMVLLLVVGGPVYFLVYQLDKNYGEFSVNMIETTTQAVYQSIFDGLMHNDSLEIQRNLEILSLGPGIQLVRIYNSTGKILYSSRHEEIHKNIFSLKDFVFIKPPFMGMKETFFKEGNTYSHHHPIYVQKECTPCHANLGDVIGVIDVHVWLTQSEQIYLSAKRLTILSAILIVVLLWLILNFLYHGQIESRLRVIINGFNELARGNLHFRIKMPGRHELAMLAQKFNQTIEKLKQAKEKEEHFIEERLERADRLITLGEVAAEIAHEVNNPASVILSRAEILRDEIKEKSSGSEYIEDLEIVIQQTERIAETTRSILHYARKLPHTFTETDLNQVIQRSIKILEPRIKKVRISIEFSPLATPARVWGNFTQLEQVFCNLLNNSLDVLSDGKGFIQIRIEKIDLVGYRPGYRVIFKDNGPGIPSENLDKVFSPFFTTKEEGKGTGLGLFIVRNIILHHRGRIYLDQNGEKGATFIIEMEALNATH